MIKVRSIEDIVSELDALSPDPSSAHQEADRLLLECAPDEVAEAYQRVIDRCRLWSFE